MRWDARFDISSTAKNRVKIDRGWICSWFYSVLLIRTDHSNIKSAAGGSRKTSSGNVTFGQMWIVNRRCGWSSCDDSYLVKHDWWFKDGLFHQKMKYIQCDYRFRICFKKCTWKNQNQLTFIASMLTYFFSHQSQIDDWGMGVYNIPYKVYTLDDKINKIINLTVYLLC